MTGDIVIEARDLVKSFGVTMALRGASVTVARGEILAVMGPSGSGKSSLLHCLAGILVPDSGEVHFAGQRIDTLGENPRSALRRDKFGFVFQFGQLVPELSAEENVALPLLLGGARRAEALRRAGEWFPRLGLEGLERHLSGEMSGGEAQRVALARGLVAGPEQARGALRIRPMSRTAGPWPPATPQARLDPPPAEVPRWAPRSRPLRRVRIPFH